MEFNDPVPSQPLSQVDEIFARANEFMEEGEFSAARATFSEVIQLCPEMEGAWGNRGYANYEMGRDSEALADFDHVIHLNPADAFGHGFRALVLRNLGRYEEALESAVIAIDLSEGEESVPPAYLVRGWLLMRAGQVAAAFEDLSTYIELTPDDQCIQPMLELARREREVGQKVCVDGPGGRLFCDVCQNPACGYSFNTSPNPNWEEEEGRCSYSHCIETFPQRNGDGPGICPLFGHDCPGGPAVMKGCTIVEDEQGFYSSADPEGEPSPLFSPGELPEIFRDDPESGRSDLFDDVDVTLNDYEEWEDDDER